MLDANVLLNMYTYSIQTREVFLGILNSLADRIWLPYQAAREYHRNRLGIIGKEIKRYADLPVSFKRW